MIYDQMGSCGTRTGSWSSRWNGCWRRGARAAGRQYLVKWTGYPAWEATWESSENLENAKEKVRRFEEEVAKREAEREQEIMNIFKGVESVAGVKSDKALEEKRKESGVKGLTRT